MERSDTELAFFIQLDEICEEFRARFTKGDSPRIEDFVDRVRPEHRETLVHELVTLEVAIRSGRGDELSADELVSRYAALLPPTENRDAAIRSTIEHALDSTHKEKERHTGSAVTASLGAEARRVHVKVPRIEGFKVQSVLGYGGMGVVFKAIQTSLNRPVALKLVLDIAGASDEYFERFEEEAKAVAELNDPHFVQIYAFGKAEGQPYMALEFVEGGSLEEFREGEPQPIDFSAETIEHVAIGILKAHEAGLVHRDLKPHNLLLTRDGTVKITDFGLVKRLNRDTQRTQQGRVMGTVSYMAPEQSRGDPDVGPAADIHALGAILYCLLTGRPPFLAANRYDTVKELQEKDPVPPSQLRVGVPKDLETICLKCLQKEPHRRYASAADLADDIKRFRENRPIVARPVSTLERAWRWAKRNPWIAGLGVAVTFLVLTVAVVSSAMSWKLSVALDSEKEARDDEAAARQDAEQARDAAEDARDVAREQRGLSLNVLRGVLFHVDDLLRDDPDQFALRQRIINQAMQGVEKVRDHAQANPLEDRTEAVVWQRLGDMYLRANRIQDAADQLDRAHAILAKLAQEDPDDPVHKRNLAAITNLRGDVQLRLGETLAARRSYQAALDLRKQWSQRIEADPGATANHKTEAKISVAQSYGLIGKANLMLGDPAAALAGYHAADEKYTAIPIEFLDALGPQRHTQNRRERAMLQQRLGDASYQLGNIEDAETYYQEALKQREELVRENGKDRNRIRDLCLSALSLGDFRLAEQKDPVKAMAEYQPALVFFERLWQAAPKAATTRRDLSAVHYRIGAMLLLASAQQITLDGADTLGTAQEHFEKSRDLRQELAKIDPSDAQSKIEWALALARCGQATEASQLATELEDQSQDDPRVLFQVACVFALCTEAEDPAVADPFRDRTFQVLDNLISAGWKDRVALKNDPDLEPVRDDTRFVEMVKKLGEKSKIRNPKS